MSAEQDEPVHLLEQEETGDRFLVFTAKNGIQLDIRYEGETLWMTQAQIAALFGVDRSVVTKHIANIYAEGELDGESTSAKIARVRQEGTRQIERQIEHYTLDVVISVGYRVSSVQATLFRRWATGILVQFAKKGFVVDVDRLKHPENVDRVRELREIIRDIRSDEANVYRELKRICALCQDYDSNSQSATAFFQRTQAKLVYAVTSHTPSEIIATRAEASADTMGLTSWSNEAIRKADVTISKNYLGEAEIRELNRLTSILLDIFEDQLELGRLVTMVDAQNLLDQQLQQLGRTVLRSGGRVSAGDAKRIAEEAYDSFNEQRKLQRHIEADTQIADLAKLAKTLPKTPR